MRDIILEKIKEIEEKENVRVIMAIDETGGAIIPACKLNIDGGYNE